MAKSEEKMTITEALRHVGPQNWDRIEQRGREALQKYMWLTGKKGNKIGYCSFCHSTFDEKTSGEVFPEYVINDPYEDDTIYDKHHQEYQYNLSGPWKSGDADGEWRHNHRGYCPACGAEVMYRDLNRGRKTANNRAFLIQYKPSAMEPGAAVMCGYLVWQRWDIWDDFNEWEAPVQTELREICVFRPGKGGERFVNASHWEPDWDHETPEGFPAKRWLQWERRKQCIGGHDPVHGIFGSPFYLDMDSVETIPDTLMAGPLIWRDCDGQTLDMIDAMRFAARYPAAEYLCKMGLSGLALAAYQKNDGGAVNLRGKTACKVLRVNGETWGFIKKNRESINVNWLKMRQLLDKHQIRIGNDAALELSRLGRWQGLEDVLNRLEGQGEPLRRECLKYCKRKRVFLHDYADHLRDLIRLGVGLGDREMLFPSDFQRTHAETTKRIRYLADREKDKSIRKNAEKLGRYWYSAYGITMRPMLTSQEIIDEGDTLHHCVGGYVDDYAAGKTVLLCLRKDEALEMPWHTVEYSTKGQRVQCRGAYNKSTPEEAELLDRFWALYDAQQNELNKTKQKGRKAA